MIEEIVNAVQDRIKVRNLQVTCHVGISTELREAAHHAQAVAKGDETQRTLWISTIRPVWFRKDKSGGICANAMHIHPTTASEALASHLEKRLTEVYEINSIKGGDGLEGIHCFDIPASPPSNVDPYEALGGVGSSEMSHMSR